MEKVALLCILMTIITLCADWPSVERKLADVRRRRSQA
jgi:hypothetical protein